MSQQIKLLLSFLERKILADLLPDLSSKLKLDTKNGRVLEFSLDEGQSILEATTDEHYLLRGVKVHAAEHIIEIVSRAIEDSQSIGAIPVGERLYQFKVSLRILRPLIWRRFQVREYDFGECWMHEVVFEGCLRSQRGSRYPICLEGERACPPEDSGGAYQYGQYVEALFDPAHKEHEQMLQWRGKHDPTQFDSEKTTKRMQRGLPNWRKFKQDGYDSH